MDVRFSGLADRGVRGDDPGSEAVDLILMGVRKECAAGEPRDGDGEGERVGALDRSCVDPINDEVDDLLALLDPFEDDAMVCSSVLSRARLCCLVGRMKGKLSLRCLRLAAFRL